ncbi:MAG: glycosyltransferase family 4 protein [Sphingomonadales bacterium]|nr:glycosyltransferase family 4 protein [Sphingomonadales bacterium]
MILVIQNKLLHYRRPFYNELCKHFEVAVLHSGEPNCNPGDKYKEIIVPVRKIGPFWWQQRLLETLSTLPIEAIIAMFDVRWLNIMLAMYRWDHKIPWIWWGLDKGASTLALKAKLWIAHRDNPIVFYNHLSLEYFNRLGLERDKLFLANNTFHVPDRVPCFTYPIKNKFINVGSLDARKQNDITIQAFNKVLQKTGRDLQYIIIGEGPERENLQSLIVKEGLVDKVVLAGSINNPKVLEKYYKEAIASVSFGQAGLAVLQSMAFGVPFLTKKNAISGGEMANIKSGENGILSEDNPQSLAEHMLRLAVDMDFARSLGEGAYAYYSQYCTVEKMAEGFLQALKYRP